MVKFQSRCMVVDGWERGMVWVLSRAPSVCLGCLACWCVRVCVRVAAWACACVCACVRVLMCVHGASRWCGLRGPLHLCVYCRCRFPHPIARRRPLLLALLPCIAAAPAAATAAVPCRLLPHHLHPTHYLLHAPSPSPSLSLLLPSLLPTLVMLPSPIVDPLLHVDLQVDLPMIYPL